jgi:preprotein translocase subunit YajC
MLPLLIIVVLFAVMVIVPGRRKARDAQTMRTTLAPGVDVVTTAGVYGRVDSIDTEQGTIDLEVSDGVIVRFASQAVARVISTDPGAESAEDADADTVGDPAAPESPANGDASDSNLNNNTNLGGTNDLNGSESAEADRKAENGSNRGTDGTSG